MSAGELETEVALPVRIEFVRGRDGELEITAIVPLSEAVGEAVRIDFTRLERREQRSLLALVRAEAEREKSRP